MKKVTELDKVKCSICNGYIKPIRNNKGKVVWSEGYNAFPIKTGRCCSVCDQNLVTPARLKL